MLSYSYIPTKNLWTSTCMWPGPHPHPLNIISVMCKERSKSVRRTYRLDVQLTQTISFVQLNASGCMFCYMKICFAECKWFKFNKFHFAKRKYRIVEYKSHVTELQTEQARYLQSLIWIPWTHLRKSES